MAAVLNGYCDRDTNITVKLRGGDLVGNYHSNGEVELMGSVKTVYEGKFETNGKEKRCLLPILSERHRRFFREVNYGRFI